MLYPEYRPTPTALSAVNPPYYDTVPTPLCTLRAGHSAPPYQS